MDTNALIGRSQASFADTDDICEALHELRLSNDKIASVIGILKNESLAQTMP